MKRSFQHFCLFFLVTALVPFPAAQDAPETGPAVAAQPWTEADSRLANHYLLLLQKNPEYGKVLTLLWELYEKKNQTPLLMDYMKKAASVEKAFLPQLIYAHLLRKADRGEEARPFYESAAEGMPDSVPALLALAAMAEQQKRSAKALAYYIRLVRLVPPGDDTGVAVRLRKAALHQAAGELEPAVEAWNQVLAARPHDLALRNEIIGRLLEAGETDDAIALLEKQAESSDVKARLAALSELEKVDELINDFEGARRACRSAMALLHFKNHQHEDFFQRLVRSYERESRLPALEEELKNKVSPTRPDEAALYLLASFYQLTADDQAEEKILVKLVEALPKNMDYRVRLAELQLANDRYADAGATLDAIIAGQGSVPLHLILLRARVDLHAEEREDAESRLLDALQTSPEEDSRARIIEFARLNHLDDLVEKMLRQSADGIHTGSDGDSAPLALARFLHERGRERQAKEVLENYVAGAGDSVVEKSRRLQQVAVAWSDLNRPDLALQSIDAALQPRPENVDLLSSRAQLLIDLGRGNEAIAVLEKVISLQTELKDRTETDQKIFSILRAGGSEKAAPAPLPGAIPSGPILSAEDYRKMAAAVSSARREADEAPPQALLDYYENLLQEAVRSRVVAKRYRAAWWAFKLQKNQDCYLQLQAAKQESEKPVIEIEELLLELAEQNDRPEHMVKILETLARIDPANREQYRHRWAEAAFRIGNEDESVRELKELAASPDASLDTLATLAKIYAEQGSPGKQVEVWQTAYRRANLVDKRTIIRQLTTALIEQNKPREALQAQMDLIEKETDILQRRKLFENQLTVASGHGQLEWLRDRYAESASSRPFDRFFPEALGKIQLALHQDKDAFASLKKAYYMADENEELLGQLSELASRLGDPGAAIYYSRQAVSRGEGAGQIEDWENLIKMLEKDFRASEAGLMRKRLEAKFGQDPDFLKRLGDFYSSRNRLDDALRLYEKRVRLQDWDNGALFDLALAKQRAGSAAEAQTLFEKIVAQTASLPVADWSRQGGLFPLVDGSPDPSAALESLSFEFQTFPYLADSAKDDLTRWIEGRVHTEFQYRPDDSYALRLRAIEEAARGSSQWTEKFLSAGNLPVHERIWAYHHAGAATPLPAPGWPDSSVGVLARALTLVRGGRNDLLASWIGKSIYHHAEAITPRSASAFAFCHLLKQQVPKASSLMAWYPSLEAPLPVTQWIFSQFRKKNLFTLASQFGAEIDKEESAGPGGALPYLMAQISAWRGDFRAQSDWLEKALNRPFAFEPDGGLSPMVAMALADRCRLAASPEEREEWLRKFGEKLARESDSPLARAQFDVARGLAAHDRETAFKALSSLTREVLQIRHNPLLEPDANGWESMQQEFRFHVAWLPREFRKGPGFAESFAGPPFSFPPPVEENVRRDFEFFETQRILVLLDGQPQAERDAIVNRAAGQYQNLDGRLDLARELEKQGYFREAARLYLQEVLDGSQDYAVLRGFLSCSDRALDSEHALPLLDKLRDGQLAFPPGLTDAYLKKYHARFLYHARQLDRLAQLSQPVDPGATGSVKSVAHIPYQDETVRARFIRGEWDTLLEKLTEERQRSEITNRDLLLGARVLLQKRNLPQALDWLDAITRNRSDLDSEMAALHLYLQVFRAMPALPKEQLKWLGRIALQYRSGATVEALAAFFEERGDFEEALSLLRLHYQNNIEKRSTGSTQLAILSLLLRRQPDDSTQIGEELGVLLAGLSPESSAGFAALLAEHRAAFLPLLPALERCQRSASAGPEAILAAAFLKDALAAVPFPEDPHQCERALWFLAHLGPIGQSVAKEEVARRGEKGSFYFEAQPEKQLRFFNLIKDEGRLLDCHSSLMRLAESYGFAQKNLDPEYGSFQKLLHLPKALRQMGRDDLAAPLYRRFYENLRQPAPEWTGFIEDYFQFLTETGGHREAEEIGVAMSRLSLGFDLRLLVTLYEKQGQLETLDQHLSRYELTDGQRALLREWQQARRSGREMEAYRPD